MFICRENPGSISLGHVGRVRLFRCHLIGLLKDTVGVVRIQMVLLGYSCLARWVTWLTVDLHRGHFLSKRDSWRWERWFDLCFDGISFVRCRWRWGFQDFWGCNFFVDILATIASFSVFTHHIVHIHVWYTSFAYWGLMLSNIELSKPWTNWIPGTRTFISPNVSWYSRVKIIVWQMLSFPFWRPKSPKDVV